MPPTKPRDGYLVGKTGSYFVPTIAKIDEAIVKLTGQIPSADRARRERIWADVDQLLERRMVMSLEAAL